MTHSSQQPAPQKRGGSFILLALIIIVGGILMLVFFYGIKHPPSQRAESGKAPDFTMTTYTSDPLPPEILNPAVRDLFGGNFSRYCQNDINKARPAEYDQVEIKLSDLKGKPVLINFWASWCTTCKDEQPLLEAAWQRYKDQVMFLGLSHLDQDKNARAWLQCYNVTYPNALDKGGKVYNAYHVQGVPETFFIDANGNVQDYYVGAFPSAAVLDGFIQKLLNSSSQE